MSGERAEGAAAEPWTVRRVLTWTTGHFEKKGVDAPRLTAEILLAHVLSVGRVRLYVDLDRPLQKAELSAYRMLIERRGDGEPTQYLVGKREFYGRSFLVDERVLIPRPETELLVESVLQVVPKDAPARVLDVCAGSGCIGVTVASERPAASVWATELSPEAAEVARGNAEALGVGGRVTVLEGDLLAPVPAGARFDVVVSNPPYVASAEIRTLSPEVQHEPRLALDGGEDGLALYRRLVVDARRVLKPGGLLALELGETQGPALKGLLEAAGYADVKIVKDLERRDRFAYGTAPREEQSGG
jgi:release factor glutamine methyltransferase